MSIKKTIQKKAREMALKQCLSIIKNQKSDMTDIPDKYFIPFNSGIQIDLKVVETQAYTLIENLLENLLTMNKK